MIKKHILFTALLAPIVALADCTNLPVEFYGAYAVVKDDETLNAYVIIKNLDNYEHTITTITGSDPTPRTSVFQNYANNEMYDDITLGASPNLVIPAHSTVMITEDDQSHILLTGYKYRPNPGDAITLIFDFADGCRETLKGVPVNDQNGDP